ncbi:MAG: cobalt-precorrin-6A reductase [Phycicoccus sp.]|nr:cobalt-precorrin-6A reductase [Phycicoccus sp.]
MGGTVAILPAAPHPGLGGAGTLNAVRVLILGGTAEARSLAASLVGGGISVTSSLAGRVSRPRLPVGEVRIGGFGGVEGLVGYLEAQGVTHLVDATHPFASTMTAHAAAAAARARVPVLRYARPGWGDRPDAAGWHWASTLEEVCRLAGELGSRPFLSSGRQTLPFFASWTDRDVLVRVVEPLDEPAPPRWTLIEDRGPYLLDGERALLREQRIDVLVTKDSGGSYTSAKLDAAAELSIPVVVLARPAAPSGLDTVTTIDAALARLGVHL